MVGLLPQRCQPQAAGMLGTTGCISVPGMKCFERTVTICQKMFESRSLCFCTETELAMAPETAHGYFMRIHIARFAP